MRATPTKNSYRYPGSSAALGSSLAGSKPFEYEKMSLWRYSTNFSLSAGLSRFQIAMLSERATFIIIFSVSLRPLLARWTCLCVSCSGDAHGGGRVVFVVDPAGRVAEAKVLSTTDSRFDAAALEAVKKWRYEPGKRNGQPVSFRVLQPITFPKN